MVLLALDKRMVFLNIEALTAPIMKIFSGFTISRLFLIDYRFIPLNHDKLTVFW